MRFLSVVICLLFFACNVRQNEDNTAADTLLVVHTNDHHGAIFPSPDGLGGLARRAAIINSLRQQYDNILILDAGDINTGGVLSNIFKAQPDILAYNLIGYDAVALGNHELYSSFEELQRQIETAEFEFISANTQAQDGASLAAPYIIRNFADICVAVIGITTEESSATFQREIDAARNYIKSLREKENPDIIILLTHIGTDKSTVLADSVAGIDLIIDGHSHTKFETPLVVNDIPIVSAFEWGKEVGQARFILEDGEVKRFDWQKKIIDERIAEDIDMVNLIKTFADSLDKSMSDSIAETAQAFIFTDETGSRLPRMGESAIGNLVCDAVMSFIEKSQNKADFVFFSGGNVRAGLPKGKITRENIMEILPFENFIEIVEMNGEEVLQLFDFAATVPQGEGGFLQVSKEVRIEIDTVNKRITALSLNNKEIDLKRKYFVAVNDYLSAGGDGYLIFENKQKYKTQKLLSDVLIEYLQEQNVPLVPILDGRVLIK